MGVEPGDKAVTEAREADDICAFGRWASRSTYLWGDAFSVSVQLSFQSAFYKSIIELTISRSVISKWSPSFFS